MRRILIISALLTAAFGAAVALAIGFMLHTAPGRALLRDAIEPQIGAALGGKADIGALEGALPGNIVLRDVRLSGDDGVWLTVARIDMDWRPLALARREIDISRLGVRGARLIAPPPAKPRDNDAPSAFTFPEALPKVAVRDFTLADASVGEAVVGRPLALDAAGRLVMGGGAFDLMIAGASDDRRDSFDVAVRKLTGPDRLVIDALVSSEADGAIAALSGVDGRLHVEAHGDGPLNDFMTTLRGEVGGYGVIDGVLSGNLDDARAIRIEATARLGEKLAAVAGEIGADIALAAALTGDADGASLQLERFESAAGSAQGTLQWIVRRGALARASATLAATLAPGYRDDLQSLLGDTVALSGELAPRRDDFAIAAAFEGGPLTIRLAETVTDLRERIGGRIEAQLAPAGALGPAFASGGEATARFAATRDAVSLEGVTASVGEGSRFGGFARIDLAGETFSVEGAGEISPAMAALFIDDARLSAPLAFDGEAAGAFSRFEAAFNARLPALVLNGRPLSPSSLEAALSGLPSLPSGDIRAAARDGSGALLAQVRSSADGRIAVPRLEARGADFTLNGAGAYDPATETVSVDLAYRGGAKAEPWPGFRLAGDLAVAGGIGRGGAGHDLKITSQALETGDFAIAGLDARANGAPGALALNASATLVEAPGVGRIDAVSFAGVADIAGAPALVVSSFEATLYELQARLTEPARLRFADGVSIERLRAALGRQGSLALDAELSSTRWRMTLDAKNAPLRAASAIVDLDLDLDTNRRAPAEGSFSAQTRLVEDGAVLIAGDLVWNGERLRLSNADSGDAIDMDISLPLKLVRAPSLSVALDGDIEGSARYAGPVEAIAAYLPPLLQTIEGRLEGRAEFAGPIDSPRITGEMTLRDAAYTEFTTGLSLTGIEARAVAAPHGSGSRIVIDAGARGPGQTQQTLTFKGDVDIGDAVAIDGMFRMNGARLSAGPVNRVVASGEVALKGPIDAVAMSGAVTLSELDAEIVTPELTGLVDIEVTAISAETGEPEQPRAEGPPPPSLAFDIAISAGDRVFVRGRGLDSEWRASVRATGTTAEPLILGSLDLRRGFIDFSGRRFTLTRGQIVFDRLTANNPVLDLRAEYETSEGVLAAIEIRGRALAPQVSLVSTPSLPSEDIMALVLFGKPATELSAIESLQMAHALAQLGGVGGLGGTGFARRALGLDMFNADFDSETGAASLEVGKYVADGLFISAMQDARGENGAVRVQYEISRSITVETQIKQTGDQTVSANWKRDF